jgi:hypothetical protein
MKHLVALALVLAACGGNGNADVDGLTAIKDQLCACHDKACTEAQHAKYLAWKKASTPATGDDKVRYDAVHEQLMDCLHKIGHDARANDPLSPHADPTKDPHAGLGIPPAGSSPTM